MRAQNELIYHARYHEVTPSYLGTGIFLPFLPPQGLELVSHGLQALVLLQHAGLDDEEHPVGDDQHVDCVVECFRSH